MAGLSGYPTLSADSCLRHALKAGQRTTSALIPRSDFVGYCVTSEQGRGPVREKIEPHCGGYAPRISANAWRECRRTMRWGGCRPPGTVSQCAKKVVLKPLSGKDGTVMKDTMIGVDLAKSVFQLHAASRRES